MCDTIYLSDFTRDRHVRQSHNKDKEVAMVSINTQNEVETTSTIPPPPLPTIPPRTSLQKDCPMAAINENPLLYVRVFEKGDPTKVMYDIYIPPPSI